MSSAAKFCRALLIVLAVPGAARAHTDKATGQDYTGFERNDGKGSCCDWHDCRPASEPFMEQDGEKIIDRGNNKFVFDPSKVVSRPSDDGNWHICGSATKLKCIIAPAQAEREPGSLDSLFGLLMSKQPADESTVLSPAEIDRELAAAPICRAGRSTANPQRHPG
jgi:hypothetical protein